MSTGKSSHAFNCLPKHRRTPSALGPFLGERHAQGLGNALVQLPRSPRHSDVAWVAATERPPNAPAAATLQLWDEAGTWSVPKKVLGGGWGVKVRAGFTAKGTVLDGG